MAESDVSASAPAPAIHVSDDDVKAFFSKFSWEDHQSKHLKYFVIPGFDLEESLATDEMCRIANEHMNDFDCDHQYYSFVFFSSVLTLRLCSLLSTLDKRGLFNKSNKQCFSINRKVIILSSNYFSMLIRFNLKVSQQTVLGALDVFECTTNYNCIYEAPCQ